MSALRAATLTRVLFAVSLAAMVLAGCGSENSTSPPGSVVAPSTGGDDTGGGGGGGGGGGTFALTLADPQPATVTVGGGAATVTATLVDSAGTAQAGQAVTFSVSPSSVAMVSAGSATTDGSGHATVTVAGLKAGQAVITATAQGVSDTATVTAVLPEITLQTSADSLDVSSAGTGGAVLTATVRDASGVPMSGLTVTFSTTLGQLTSVTSPASGQYQATLTSTKAGLAAVTATASGAESEAVQITFQAGALASLKVSPSPSQIPPDGATASTLSIVAQDGFGNAIDGTVTLATTLGTLSQANVELDNGEAQVTFTSTVGGTAHITATMADAPGVEGTADVVVVVQLAGEPANILVSVVPEVVTVAGVGGNEVATITIDVVDNAGDPIDDSAVLNNLEVEIVDGPGGGENVDGNVEGEVLTLSTVNGRAVVSFQSGILPGTVRMELRVVKGRTGNAKVPALTAVVPQITINAGPPFSLFLGQSTRTTDNADGTYTTEYFSIVSDRYGNAVPDGTAVSFGLFVNYLSLGFATDPVTGQMIDGDGSITAGSNRFTSASATFVSDGVGPGDTVAILNGSHQGGYLVQSVVDENTLATYTTFGGTESSLQYAVGNNGGVGGTVITPSGEAATIDGKATWPNTYAVDILNEPVFIYAETEGRKLGDARLFSFPFLIPVTIDLQGPDTANVPGTPLDYTAYVWDGGNPAIPLPNLGLDVSVDIAKADVSVDDGDFNSTGLNSVTAYTGPADTNQRGLATFTWTVPTTAQVGDTYTITVRFNDTKQTKTVTIE